MEQSSFTSAVRTVNMAQPRHLILGYGDFVDVQAAVRRLHLQVPAAATTPEYCVVADAA